MIPTGLITDRHRESLFVEATATFSPCRTYRYALTRTWDADRPSAVFIMLNPSVGDAFQLDPTLRRCIGFAKAWHAGGIVVANAFGLRATDPKALRGHPDPVGPDNDQVIAEHFTLAQADILRTVVAWGAGGRLNGRDRQVVELLRQCGVEPTHLGLTKSGHPRHPLYLPGNAAPEPFRMGEVPSW